MHIKENYDRFETWLETWPDSVLTLILLLLAAVLVLIALRGTALEKAIVTAWVIFP